jgi:hypothetical protein
VTIEEVEEGGSIVRSQLLCFSTIVLKIRELNLEYIKADILECPVHSYMAKDYKLILKHWELSKFLHILGVPIPLKYWAQVFQNKRSVKYNCRKHKWKQWKVRSL